MDKAEIKSTVGHSKNMDTLGTYAHKVKGQQEKVAEKIERIFADILTVEKSSGL